MLATYRLFLKAFLASFHGVGVERGFSSPFEPRAKLGRATAGVQMQAQEELQHKYWDFIENGDFGWEGASPEENVYFREVVAAFLRTTFQPPAGYVIDVLEAEYVSRFPVVALGWNFEHEPLSLPERQELVRSLAGPLNRFVSAVDWNVVAQIKFGLRVGGSVQHSGSRLALTWLRGHEPDPWA